MNRNPVQYLHGVLAGVSFAGFLGIMGATTAVPLPDGLAVGCFAVSIPMNAFTFICKTDLLPDWRHRVLRCLFRFGGLFIGYAGLAFSFAHFGWLHALLFFILAVVAHRTLDSIADALARAAGRVQPNSPRHE
ncbi:MAG TPA: hypothetical protein VMU04_18660 [Candidatus Acidoferrum sp.]|nr:hypothetical protein [Candidatus Acidoferrum sp.]